MFPFEIEEEEQIEQVEEQKEPKEYEIDFQTGQLTGRMVTGLEAIKTWAWLALQVPRYRFVQYSWDYGNELEELVSHTHTQDYIQAEAERMVQECLCVNPWILGVEEVTCERRENTVLITVHILTEYGEGDVDVRADDL